MLLLNEVKPDDLVSIIFTATPDITASFPAAAARAIGLTDVPLLGAQESQVEGAPRLCIRIMIHTAECKPRSTVKHVYLHGAKVLRPDLVQEVKLNIAIDGPAGAGKSTVAKELASLLRLRYLDTGAMYRALTWLALKQGLDLNNEEGLAGLAKSLCFGLDQQSQVTLAGQALGEEIRTPQINQHVSLVSSYPLVRTVIVAKQRAIALAGGIVMDGRDIGTTVMIDAPVKVFLVADLHERARRRLAELKTLGHQVTLNELATQMQQRDEFDSGRAASPLKPALDAVVLDTTHLTPSEVVKAILAIVAEKTGGVTPGGI